MVSKSWTAFMGACHFLHDARGCPLKDVTVTMIQEATYGFNFTDVGCFALMRNDQQAVVSVRHWSGAHANLACPIAGEVAIVDNHHEKLRRSQ